MTETPRTCPHGRWLDCDLCPGGVAQSIDPMGASKDFIRNGRIVGCAFEMFEICKAVVEYFETPGDPCNANDPLAGPLLERAKAIVEKVGK